MRVVLAHHVADDAGRLLVGLAGEVARLPHAEEHPPVHRLQPVAHVGQRAPDDDAHRVVEITALHLLFDVDRHRPLEGKHRVLVGHALSSPRSDVQVAHVERVCLDELAARLDLVAHEDGEDVVGFDVVLDLDLQQAAASGGPSWSPRAARRSSRRGPCSAGSRGPSWRPRTASRSPRRATRRCRLDPRSALRRRRRRGPFAARCRLRAPPRSSGARSASRRSPRARAALAASARYSAEVTQVPVDRARRARRRRGASRSVSVPVPCSRSSKPVGHVAEARGLEDAGRPPRAGRRRRAPSCR